MTSHSEPKAKNPMVKITADGKVIEAPKGGNLLKALLDNGVSVPHYCYHPGLSVAGCCRMCFVEVEGQPRPLISCNATVTENMVVKTQTETVKNIQKWNLAFHLINHPLDCPICDQAGECGLQNYYMQFGKYESRMEEEKVKKRKVIPIGDHVMLDTERCILCSRCVRFFDEVPKTSEMAIFNRGDRSEIGTYEDKALNNNYTLNSVDICPVGALTSRDFRFKRRVWFLKDIPSICPGCSTGCNVTISQDPIEKRTYRMRPRFNEEVNGYWMCDYGRMRYKHTHRESRISTPLIKKAATLIPTEWDETKHELFTIFKTPASQISVLITPQYTSEDITHIYDFFTKTIGTQNIFHCADSHLASDSTVTDELLFRRDKNPNSQGLLKISAHYKLQEQNLSLFQQKLKSDPWTILFIFGPHDLEPYPEFLSWFKENASPKTKIYIGTQVKHQIPLFDLLLPTLTFIETEGTFVNFKGLSQKLSRGVKLIPEAKPICEILC